MDLGNKNLNDLISKDNNVSTAAAQKIINGAEIESFTKLCEKSEFLFDFIKEKINEKLFFAINSENLENIFKFIKVYNSDFEDFIIKAWVKFADEDLTDKILEILETGTNEEKTYAAGYFYYINDPLALENLRKHALSDFEPLAQNCARALAKFNDREIYNRAVEIIQSSCDDFEKYKYVNFLVSYEDKNAFDILYNYLENTYMKGFAASSILYLKNFNEIIKDGAKNKAAKIFDIILSTYPEEISLDTVFDFEIFNFIKFISKEVTGENLPESYIKRLLLKAKYKFNLIAREDIYTFDLNKDVKKEINIISEFLNTLQIDLFQGLQEELNTDEKERILEAYDTILNFGKKELAPAIADTVNATEHEDVIAEGIKILKIFGELSQIKKDEIINKIRNENIKAIVLNTFN